MCNLRTLALTCFFIVCTFKGLFAQITISSTNGCLPNGITNAIFTYVGSGTPTNIVWDFGDGSPTSNLNPTQHSYPNLGTFTVTFSAIVNGNTVTHTATVVVNPQPTGAFTNTVPGVHCAPMTVSFTGTSPSGNVTYQWDFGDGSINSGNPINHAYTAQGIFYPILTVQNTVTGCFANITGGAINVSTPPTVLIDISPAITTCATTLNATFNGSNSISGSPLAGGGLSYAWNFGSFGTSTGVSPASVLFQPQGIYPVTVTVTDNNSCSSTSVIPISLIQPTVSAIVPATVCVASQETNLTAPLFTVTVESNIPATNWDMGDGTPAFNFPLPIWPNPFPPALQPNTPYTNTIYAYSIPGLKTLTITASSGSCIATINPTIMVEQVMPMFAAVPPNYTCSPSFALGYLNQTTVNTANPLSYTWTTDHWSKDPLIAYTTTAVNPTINVVQNSTNPYIMYGAWIPRTNLFVKSAIGCTAEIALALDTIFRATASFKKNKKEGCAPLVVDFEDNSKFDDLINPFLNGSMNPIVSYTWDAGDGINTVVGTGSTIPNQTFTYTSPGTYTPFLTIQTALGCVDVSFVDTIYVVNPPAFNFTVPVGSFCAGQTVTVNLAPAPGQNVQHWHVESDDGYFSDCVADRNPVWKLNHVGVHNFTISAYNRSCLSTSVTAPSYTVRGPVARFRYETQCTGNKNTVKFNCYANDGSTGTLNLGDGSPLINFSASAGAVTSTLITHTFPGRGFYVVTLTVTNNNGCPASVYTKTVQVTDIRADFTLTDDAVCKSGGLLGMDASASQDVLTSCSSGYYWMIDNDTAFSTENPLISPFSLHGNVGTHIITLRVKDVNGCTDQMSNPFRISHPTPGFTFNKNPICTSEQPVQLINIASQSPDSIIDYQYNMGNGVFNNTNNFIFDYTGLSFPAYNSFTYSPTYSYAMGNTQTMTFTVTQIVTNKQGCVDSIKQTLVVNNPQILFASFKTTACVGEAVQFGIIAGSTHTNYNIYFGDSVAFNTTAYNTNNMYYRAHTYYAPGVFTPTATLTDNVGCTVSTTLQPITVNPYPVASFSLMNAANGVSGTEFCFSKTGSGGGGFTGIFTSTSLFNGVGNLSYIWNNGKGIVPPNTPTVGGTFTTTGTYTAGLYISADMGGCSDYKELVFTLYDPHIDFKLVPDTLKEYYCLGEPITVSVSTTNGSQYFIWDFGNGVVQPKIYLPAPGPLLTAVYNNTYFPSPTGQLTISATGYAGTFTNSAQACNEVKRKTVTILRVVSDFKRNDELDITDFRHCLGEQDVFESLSTTNSTGALTYTWNYGDNSSGYVNPASHTYSVPGVYSIELIGMEPLANCQASISKTIEVLPLPTSSLSVTNSSCPDVPFNITGSGTPGVSGVVSGTLDPNPLNLSVIFDSLNVFTSTITAQQSTTYSLVVKDNNGCISPVSTASIYIPSPTKHIDWDTLVVIGQETPLNAYLGPGYTYTWSPEVTWLNCDTCLFYNPVSSTTVDITYTVMVEDSMKCSIEKNTYRIKIKPVISLDVPTAFTPNGDGINDIIYPNGWGLRKLLYFKVFNRWGQLLFESNDFKNGWNGIYQDVPQNMETYVYQVSAETFLETEPVLTKTGTFKLIR